MKARPRWEEFVIAYGAQAHVDWLAAITGASEEDIVMLRRHGVCHHRPKGEALGFAELFTAWHGRAPEEQDWPKPRRRYAGGYEWLTPELSLLANLVGQMSTPEIVEALTLRLQQVTGDAGAYRNKNAVMVMMQRIGLQATDVIGGITVNEAAKIVGSAPMIYSAIHEGLIATRRVGRLHVIVRESFDEFLQKRELPPEGYVKLAGLKGPLGITSDKLSEWARAGRVPTAIRCNPFGHGHKNTKFGTWWILEAKANELINLRHQGEPMPWHTKSDPHNLKTTWTLLQERRHPDSCASCQQIWGEAGAPREFDDYALRYPPLPHGAKRHLTRVWTIGLTLEEVAAHCHCDLERVGRALLNGVLRASETDQGVRVSRTDATLWRARRCPDGNSRASWIELYAAAKQYQVSIEQLQVWIAEGKLRTWREAGPDDEEIVRVPKAQCYDLKARLGFTEAEAAERTGLSIPRMRELLRDLDWRGDGVITLDVVNAIIKRIESQEGWTYEDAAAELGQTVEWVRERVIDGTVRVARSPGDQRRHYLSAPMMRRLRKVLESGPRRRAIPIGHISAGRAAVLAGVSITTLNRWYAAGEVTGEMASTGLSLQVDSVKTRARRYWETVRFKRVEKPAWLAAEASA